MPALPEGDFDEWYVKVLKIAGFVMILPIAIVAGLFAGSDWEREKLANCLDSFQKTTRESIEKQENDIRKNLKVAIGCTN